MPKIKEIIKVIEEFAPKDLQESYDNAGLQVGDPEAETNSVLICLDMTEDLFEEAASRQCNLIITHHPLIFKGLKELTGKNAIERIVIKAIKKNIAIYSAHTNLDSAKEGVSHEIAAMLGLKDVKVLEPKTPEGNTGLGVTGVIKPTPKLEFLRKVKETFDVKCLKYSAASPQLVVRKAAVCGGAGASLINEAVKEGADIIITGDVKYHDFTTFAEKIIIADIGHYESELCSRNIMQRLLNDNFPDLDTYVSQKESNPINFM